MSLGKLIQSLALEPPLAQYIPMFFQPDELINAILYVRVFDIISDSMYNHYFLRILTRPSPPQLLHFL
jgi:hypothetical protein